VITKGIEIRVLLKLYFSFKSEISVLCFKCIYVFQIEAIIRAVVNVKLKFLCYPLFFCGCFITKFAVLTFFYVIFFKLILSDILSGGELETKFAIDPYVISETKVSTFWDVLILCHVRMIIRAVNVKLKFLCYPFFVVVSSRSSPF